MIAVLAAAAMALWTMPATAGDVSEATRLLFQVPYLAQLQPGTTIVYAYKRTSSDEQKYGRALEDTIRVDVSADMTDVSKRSAMLHIFSGTRQRNIGPFSQTEGNPAIMIILEQDTFELKRRIGGQPAYFRNRIRRALRESAVVEAMTINHNGREIPGRTITIEPFKGDRNMSNTPDYASILYRFVVSSEVPGGIFEISSLIPAAGGGDETLRQISMSFDKLKEQ
jgi:hypothetical protein